MDYLVGFIFGYLCNRVITYLRNLAEYGIDNKFINREDWDFGYTFNTDEEWSHDDLP